MIKSSCIKFLRLICFFLSYLLIFSPRNKRIWVFGGLYGERFADNSKWFYLYCNSLNGPIRVIWITRSRILLRALRENGFESYLSSDLLGIWYCLIAGVYVFDSNSSDINFWLSKGAFKVNLWHGIPLKKIASDITNENDPNYIDEKQRLRPLAAILNNTHFLVMIEKYNMFISTSELVSGIFCRAFGLTKEKVTVTGYPRNDVLTGDISELDPFLKKDPYFAGLKKAKESRVKIIMYMPTFRCEDDKNMLPMDWATLDKMLVATNSILYFKPHVSDDSILPSLTGTKNIFILPAILDPYPFLKVTDVLITDYSSVFFDFALLNRPMIFYAYDLDYYAKRDRGFYFDYSSIVPGLIASNPEELISGLNDHLNSPDVSDKYLLKNRELLDNFHKFTDANSNKRVYDQIIKSLGVH